MKAFLKVVNVEVTFTIKHYQIVTVALVIAEKQILAMFRAVFLPMLPCNFYSRCLGVSVPGMLDILSFSIGICRLSFSFAKLCDFFIFYFLLVIKIKSGRFSLPDLIHIDVGFPSIIIARSPL